MGVCLISYLAVAAALPLAGGFRMFVGLKSFTLGFVAWRLFCIDALGSMTFLSTTSLSSLEALLDLDLVDVRLLRK